MFSLEAHGTMTVDTTTLPMWRAALDGIVCSQVDTSVDEIDEIVTRKRLQMWWRDGMTVAMAAESVATWIKVSRPAVKAQRETDALRRLRSASLASCYPTRT